ncbi:MAG: zf-HC2 domain-containing protein [Bacteroidetes bacterium]|jgi:hypothetical protein|nr:zf-HC2 domain-containing protein [Bacteroidota bacterium]
MYSNKTDIFQNSSCLSKEKLLAYSRGTLSAAEQHEVEKHLTDCELCSDALEGIELLHSTHPLDDTVREISAKYTSGHEQPQINRWWYAAASVVLLIATGWVFSVYNNFNEEKIASKLPEATPLSAPLPPPADVNVNANTNESATDSEMKITTSQQQPIAQEETNFATKKKSEHVSGITNHSLRASKHADTIVLNENIAEVYAATDTKALEPAKDAMTDQPDVMSKAAAGAAVSESVSLLKNINGYKTYYYAHEYTLRQNASAVQHRERTDDVQKAKDKSRSWNNIRIDDVDYETFLENALSDMKLKKFENALQKFQLILSEHPDDVNALYYGAWCYAEIGQNNKSLLLLDKLDASANHTFIQESAQLRARVKIK